MEKRRQEDITALAEDIGEAAGREKEQKKKLDGVVKELKRLAKDVKTQQKATGKMVDKAVNQVMAKANSFPSQLEDQAQDAISTVTGVSAKAEQSLQKEMDSMEKDAYNGVKTLRKVLSVGQI